MDYYRITFYEIEFMGSNREEPFICYVRSEGVPTQEQLKTFYYRQYDHRHKKLAETRYGVDTITIHDL